MRRRRPGEDWRGRQRASRCRCAKVPGDRDAPPPIRLRGLSREHRPGAGARPADRGGIATERLLASIAVSKYADGLPLYRQEAIFAREKADLGRNLMAGWMGHIGFHLEPLADRLFQLVRDGDRIFADETTLPVLARPDADEREPAICGPI